MDLSAPHQPIKLAPEAQEFVEYYFGNNLSDAELLEIKESLHHLGKAIYLYHFQKNGGGNG